MQRLSTFGAAVVALGVRSAPLEALAHEMPNRVETLTLDSKPRTLFGVLSESWAANPLHIYLDLMPLIATAEASDPAPDIERSAHLAAALHDGLGSGRALGGFIFEAVDPLAPTLTVARGAGFAGLSSQIGKRARPARIAGLRLSPVADWDRKALLSAGDAALMLCHPVSRGVAPGAVIDWQAP
ncbi:hypothetical protein KUH32_13240 [Thalassococcus sp. CAU 1522]|uniref:Uncharacterized protein n=1 Tax=Thalassococcus arenae TaxID=2851652 RepID=A0ABS6N9Q7_9RHOB|nr:hypothetical protein [Thalassococcus arenae]MBV2360746.1 hypothetical protein [Thalassococcus arenae]